MEKENKTRTICMECLHSVIRNKHESDPKEARLIITYSCDKCAAESNDIQFYNFQMRSINETECKHHYKDWDGISENARCKRCGQLVPVD